MSQPPQQAQYAGPPAVSISPRVRMYQRRLKMIVVVVLLSLVGGGIASTVWLLYKSASLDIILENRYLGTAPYYITVDGSNVSSGTIASLHEVRLTVSFTWSVASCLSHWVNGTAWVDGQVYSSDYERPVVCSGTHTSIRLIV